MGVSMIVRKAFRPGGSGSPLLPVGSPFEASTEAQAKLCRAMGWCENAPATAAAEVVAPASTYSYEPRIYAAKKTAAKKVAAKKTSSFYERRDMRADDE